MIWLPFTLGLGAAIGFGWYSHDWISAGFVLFITFMAWRGFYRGGATIVASIVAILAAIRWAGSLSPLTSRFLDQVVEVPDHWRGPVYLAFAGMSMAVGCYVSIRILATLVLLRLPGLKGVDRWAGALLGALQGGILGLLLLLSAVVLEPVASRHVQQHATKEERTWQHRLSAFTVMFVHHARESSVSILLDAMRPVTKRLSAEEMAKVLPVQRHSDATTQTHLLQLADSLRNDPVVLRDFARQFGFDEEAVRAVLDSPEFSAIVEPLSSRIPSSQGIKESDGARRSLSP
jgi:uncharacterized membrane protein required for colicin V production